MWMTLEAHNLAFGYRGHPVGRDVDMSVREGEIVCLLGPNGGGKTTLFKTLLGLLPRQGGEVLLRGVSIGTMRPREIARSLSYVPQAHEGYFPFTVRDVVLMGRTANVGLFASPTKADRSRADGALEELGIGHLADAIYTRISGGERQLTLIARALAQDARIMVLDEPTASLDFGNQVRVLERVLVLASRGIGILLSTHNPDHALLCARRVLLLHAGRVIQDGAPARVITPDNLRTLYGVDVELMHVGSGTSGRAFCIPLMTRLAGAAQ
jgi:iron complex transport system ATP-binding protein